MLAMFAVAMGTSAMWKPGSTTPTVVKKMTIAATVNHGTVALIQLMNATK